jgi:hypothetical protein
MRWGHLHRNIVLLTNNDLTLTITTASYHPAVAEVRQGMATSAATTTTTTIVNLQTQGIILKYHANTGGHLRIGAY